MLAWQEEYRIGVEELDGQHAVLFGIINQLDWAIANGTSGECLRDVLFGLRAYAEFHFHTEEVFMARYGFTGADDHKQSHVALLRQIDDIIEARHPDLRTKAIDAKAFTVDWVLRHIQRDDRELADFIASCHGGTVSHAAVASFFPR